MRSLVLCLALIMPMTPAQSADLGVEDFACTLTAFAAPTGLAPHAGYLSVDHRTGAARFTAQGTELSGILSKDSSENLNMEFGPFVQPGPAGGQVSILVNYSHDLGQVSVFTKVNQSLPDLKAVGDCARQPIHAI